MNNYHIYEEIGRGKYSVVYKGRKKKSIEYVAVKSVEKGRRKKVLNEVRIFHNLDHVNILKFTNWYETRNHLWIIFEYCAGGDLFQLIEQDTKLPENSTRIFGKELLQGLLYLHSHSIIYCDLKPSNVLLNEYGTLKLSDFGLAKKLEDLEAQEADSSKRGTPYYMAPELFDEGGVYSFYSDFWAFGCILYEFACGQPPFVSNKFQELVNQILHSDVPSVPNYSAEFNSLLADLFQKDPAKRISWQELTQHPWWGQFGFNLNVTMPDQPVYEAYLHSRGATQRTPSNQTSSAASPMTKGVDVVRMSQNIQRNLLRESSAGGYEAGITNGDFNLLSKDLELNFGENDEEEGAADVPSEEGTPHHDEEEEEKFDVFEEDEKQAIKQRPITAPFEPPKPTSITPKTRPQPQAEVPEEEDKRPTTVNLQRTASASKQRSGFKPVPIEQLLIHTSDTAVKPIIGNRDIEKPMDVTYNSAQLNFNGWSPDEILAQIESHSFENHLNEIYVCLGSNIQINEKLNVLCYFESIIINSTVANRLINSAFVNLLTKMLRVSKSPQVRIRLCSIIGQLIRHATVIEPELASSGLSNLLTELIKDKNERVRRKAMASLGEYLFYAATQMDEEQCDEIWEIANVTVGQVVRCLKSGEDEIVRAYATKIIENITAQSRTAGSKFATQEVAQHLIQIFLQSKHEYFRCAASVCLSHVVRLNGSLFVFVMEKCGLRNFAAGLAEDQPRVQQALLTMLNLGLQNPPARLAQALFDEKSMLPALVKLLEHPGIVVRGKTLLVFMFLFNHNSRWMLKVSENKFYQILDRMTRDSFKYVQCCLHHLLDTITEITVQILRTISEGMAKAGKHTSMQLFPAVLYVSNCHAARSKLNYPVYIHLLSTLVNQVAQLEEEQERILTMVLESFAGHQKALVSYAEVVVQHLLPALISRLESDNSEVRCTYLKIFTDLILPYLGDENTYDPYNTGRGLTRQLNEIMVKRLTPCIGFLLSDNDPIPLYTFKLLSFILDRNVVFVNILKRHNLLLPLLDHFEVSETRLNTHVVKIVKKIVECKDVSTDELSECDVVKKCNGVFRYIAAKDQDWCVDLMLEIISDLLVKSVDSVRRNESMIEGFENSFAEPLLQNFSLCTELLSSGDPHVVDRASICLTQMLQLFGMSRSLYFTHECLPSLVHALSRARTTLQKKILRVIGQAARKHEFSEENKAILVDPLEQVMQSEEAMIAQLATEVGSLLKF